MTELKRVVRPFNGLVNTIKDIRRMFLEGDEIISWNMDLDKSIYAFVYGDKVAVLRTINGLKDEVQFTTLTGRNVHSYDLDKLLKEYEVIEFNSQKEFFTWALKAV